MSRGRPAASSSPDNCARPPSALQDDLKNQADDVDSQHGPGHPNPALAHPCCFASSAVLQQPQASQRSTAAPSRERYEPRNNDTSSRSIPAAVNRTGRRRTAVEPPATRRQRPICNDSKRQGQRRYRRIAAGHKMAMLAFTRQGPHYPRLDSGAPRPCADD